MSFSPASAVSVYGPAGNRREQEKIDEMSKSNGTPHAPAHRVIASLNRQQGDFLDKIGKDAQFSSGLKLSRTDILAAMVNALKRLDLTGDGVRTAEQFEQRIVDAIMTHRARGGRSNG